MHEVELVESSPGARRDDAAGARTSADRAGADDGGRPGVDHAGGDPAGGDRTAHAAGAPGRPRDGARPGTAFVRRHRVRLVAAGLVVAAALAVGTVRDARADRARAAELAVAPAVLDATGSADGAGLERWRRPALDGLVAGDGLVATAGVTGAGVGGVAAYDATTGAALWDAEVDSVGPQGELTCVLTAGAGREVAGDDGTATAGDAAGGRGAPGEGSSVACVAVPAVGKEAWGGLGRRGDVRVVVLDAATGTLVRDDPADRSDVGLTALGPDLVLTRTVPGGGVRVTREVARTGADVWTADVDARAPDARGPQPAVTRVERGLLVVDGGAVRVLDGDGDPVGTWPAGVARPDVPVALTGDDGSVPDLGLVARPAGDGVDLRAAAGTARWSAGTAADSALVVQGRVVTSDATGTLTARDAGSGGVLWSADATRWTGVRASTALGAVQTDGEHLLVPLLLADGSPVLVAVGAVDGRAAWTAPLPPDVRSVERSGRRLLGRTATEVVALGQD
ncbi:PQQ-binding-like beta-propeller repeat protein [Cellulomonas sp. NS3]|uniref:PQQ-binding-like beta-propeller repeat protein n=1 Tax=Cellulomonas sp. NS3 TaxID=2973977 RepID=UPI0021632D2F|nr:PQQ-binding-like beta-propeller repeat protein [Cellulomonas sp. NS3]